MEIIAYEMKYTDACAPESDIACVPFDVEFFQEYKRIYNECFYEMRKALDIQPYHFLNADDQITEKAKDISTVPCRMFTGNPSYLNAPKPDGNSTFPAMAV